MHSSPFSSTPPARRERSASLVALLLAALVALSPATASAAERLALSRHSLDLPGAPALVVATDLDGDPHRDLLVVLAYSAWDRIAVEERRELDEVAGLVEVMTVIPALVERRELAAFRGQPGGGYRAIGEPLPLPLSVLALEAEVAGWPALLLTDDGVAGVRLAAGEPEEAIEEKTAGIEIVPLLDRPPVLAGARTFLPRLELAHDLTGDGQRELILPADDGLVIVRRSAETAETAEATEADATDPAPALAEIATVPWPESDDDPRGRLVRRLPLPQVRDVTGDGRPDLLLADLDRGWRRFHVAVALGEGRFRPSAGPFGEDPDEAGTDQGRERRGAGDQDGGAGRVPRPQIAYYGDLDGDGIGEVVHELSLGEDADGFRQEIREAKEPPVRYLLHRGRLSPAAGVTDPGAAGLSVADAPYQTIDTLGYAFGIETPVPIPGGFQDLDGDGRLDLITLTLDFSIFQAVRILATKRISIGLDFHIFCQRADGRFRKVAGLDLSGKFRLDLDNLEIGQLSQFAGDFDGDGRVDFVQIGRGRRVTVHRGGEGCTFPARPDLTIELSEEPQDLSLVRVDELDGDGRADLLVVQPADDRDGDGSSAARLDLYLSGSAR